MNEQTRIKNGEIVINPEIKYRVSNIHFTRENKSERLSVFDKFKNEWRAELILNAVNESSQNLESGAQYNAIKLIDLETKQIYTLRNVKIFDGDNPIKLRFTLTSKDEIK